MKKPMLETPWPFWECCNERSRSILFGLLHEQPDEKLDIESVDQIDQLMREPSKGKLPG